MCLHAIGATHTWVSATDRVRPVIGAGDLTLQVLDRGEHPRLPFQAATFS